eukprot:TRINITY_DN259_c1_g1_i2.p1 TRINITY_DN259_c1_g1~~TRINITY_DN259_c1_g1_i2.p1  ORF type:complete len:287 (+),score=68.45 TRINITY_DN259_c1_g1_i2:302-1162(+)
MQLWLQSKSYQTLNSWLHTLNSATLSKSNFHYSSSSIPTSISLLLNLLNSIDQILTQVPPLPGQMRYGNTAFRDFHSLFSSTLPSLLSSFPLPAACIKELSGYLLDSFGNKTRIDYGTGHELHFIIFLYCYYAVGMVESKGEELGMLVGLVFKRYLEVARRMQQRYGLEPAGSRGVWCLDDYQFVPFILGAGQLVGNEDGIEPKGILEVGKVKAFAEKYLYMGCIEYILSVKKGPFFEHSPDLFNISGAASWEKINKGMFLKYNDDVLVKFPVIQHMLFGSIFPFH